MRGMTRIIDPIADAGPTEQVILKAPVARKVHVYKCGPDVRVAIAMGHMARGAIDRYGCSVLEADEDKTDT